MDRSLRLKVAINDVVNVNSDVNSDYGNTRTFVLFWVLI